MEFVAERFRRKFVALVYAGSNPVKLPKKVKKRLVSSVGSEHDATNVGVGSSSLSRVTIGLRPRKTPFPQISRKRSFLCIYAKLMVLLTLSC